MFHRVRMLHMARHNGGVDGMQLEVARLRWTLQAIDARHLTEHGGVELTDGPILVSPMNDGNLFVHDGRHRAIRAQRRGDAMIEGELLA